MPTDTQILGIVKAAFSDCPRPAHFTNFNHCEECAEHDELFRSREIDTLRIDDVGNPAHDPICFLTAAGFAYYIPALVRFALAEPSAAHGWYAEQLLFHLCGDGHQNRRFLACTPGQRRAIAEFLRHLIDSRSALADVCGCADELCHALEIWTEEI